MQELTPEVAAELRETVLLARQGRVGEARARAEAALAASGGHGAIHALLGMLCCQSGDLAGGVPHLNAAFRKSPDDMTIAANLASALIELGRFGEAAEVCSVDRARSDPTLRLWRLRGFACQQLGDEPGAADAYRHIVAQRPDDWESWNNLGNALAATGDKKGAITALREAGRLSPRSGPVQLNLARSLVEGGRAEEAVDVLRRLAALEPGDVTAQAELAALLRHLYRDAEAAEALERAVRLDPNDANLWLQLGEQYTALWDTDGAERAFRRVVRIDAANASAYVQLAVLMEHTNREDELSRLLAEAEAAEVESGALHFIRALLFRREKEFAAGLRELLAVPPDVEPIRLAQLKGEFLDRLGDADAAFAAFGEMNRLFRLDPSDPVKRARRVRGELVRDIETVSASWVRSWSGIDLDPVRSPVFLVGFPRSGTTLLDTMLMGHSSVQILEERPPLRIVEEALGGLDRLAGLGSSEAAALRTRYFEEVGKCIEWREEALLIDKSPLHINKVPLIHRLFPDARILLALRHPCDAVLSCFITSFRLNDSMSNFVDLATTAEFYDLSFTYWSRCAEVLPIEVATVRYEDVVEAPEEQLRRTLAFIGLPWEAAVLDHSSTARRRGLISTASYAQVTEKIYARAAGRWQRYRTHLDPVLPVLEPWVRRFGYEL